MANESDPDNPFLTGHEKMVPARDLFRRKHTEAKVRIEARQQNVPPHIIDAFFQGLDDVEQGRIMSIDETLAEGRRMIAEYRAKARVVMGADADDPK